MFSSDVFTFLLSHPCVHFTPIGLGFFVLQFWTRHFSLETSHIHSFLLFYCFIFLLIVSSLLNCVILVFYPDDGRFRKLGFYLFGFYPNSFIAS